MTWNMTADHALTIVASIQLQLEIGRARLALIRSTRQRAG